MTTTRWWKGQMTLCWHPDSPGVTVYVWRSWWRKRRPFASLSEMERYYRPDFDARVGSGSTSSYSSAIAVPSQDGHNQRDTGSRGDSDE